MPYCAAHIAYPACLPAEQSIPPSMEYPLGRWSNHTVINKDLWVREATESHIFERIDIEATTRHVKRRFRKNGDCQLAFRRYMCWINFPRCDADRNLTLPTCQSACENYFRVCNYDKDLWRCGKSKYFNGYSPEKATLNYLGNVTYLREYFPGQPFRQNKYNKAREEEPICTPAITGAGSNSFTRDNMMVLLSIPILSLFILSII